jgi:ribose transport system ATP-binding protein
LLRLIFGADLADSGTVALGSPAQVVSIRRRWMRSATASP